MTAADVISAEQRYLLQTYARPEFVIERGEGCYLYDSEGRRYLDCVAGIAVNALGYGDPDVARAIRDHANGLIHLSNLYHSRPAVELAQTLVNHTSWADRVFFCNSGAEAVEGALKFSRRYARDIHGEGKTTIVAFSGSFHGRTMGAVAVTAREKYRQPFEPVMPGVRFIPFNDSAAAAAAITDDVCGVIVEPIQGEGGLSVATPEFLRALRERCDAVDALLIFDEIQCGIGRTGTLWAHEPYGVAPDLMTIAKPLGGGLPIGAILMRQKVAQAIHTGDHGTTFGGGPFVTAVAQTVFRKIADPTFLAHVREVGDYLGEALADLQAARPNVVLEVRGRGLMRGVVINGSSSAVREAAHNEGLLIATAGDDVLRLVPPLILTRAQVDEAIEKLTRALDAAS
ncbi:aspartate aminotransferase family protein [Roseiflexus sp. RS-1]|uniref:aspartate aminotransferase family protein n=1 Tax=Roseiflexus sp. (strain RS-1) TaxID=357808 RepID=UPI0000D7F6C0|nr:aspartate aminotransferase family protein [Roseiflexus sp. RS-1]ABQ89255.1 acetylornithine aminotransferase [Roseiflexus sp. RS-1]